MNDETLERKLVTSAAAITYPATPDLTLRVLARLSPPAPRPALRLSPAYVLAAVVLLLAAALAVAPSRDAIARLFGVEGSKIEVLPTTVPGVTPTPFPTPNAGQPGRVVNPVDLAVLPRLAGFEAALPLGGGPRLYSTLIFYGGQPVAVHYYATFDLWQTRLPQDASFGKLIEAGSIQEAVTVKGESAIWLSGSDHFVRYLQPDGREAPGSGRLVEKSTLIWRTSAYFYRIETDLPRDEALRIAETLP